MGDLIKSEQASDPPLKRCTKCGQENPATTLFFYSAGNNKLRAECKECRAAYRQRPNVKERNKAHNAAYYQRDTEKWREHARNRYHSRERHERALEYQREYRNRPGVREREHEWHIKRWQDPKRRQRMLDRMHVYQYGMSPEARRRKRARDNSYHKNAYRSRPEDRDRRRLLGHIRRARKRGVNGTHTHSQIQDLLRRQHYKCYYCSAKFERNTGKYIYHIEHTFPLSRVAGTDIPANSIDYIVLACPPCNLSKGNKYPWEWAQGGRLL